jgi:hypothetical protein
MILVVFENGLPTVAAIHYVIYCTGILESELARHGDSLPKPGARVN